MIKENNITVENNLMEVLKEKEQDFKKNVFEKYSKEEKINFINNNISIDKSDTVSYFTMLGFSSLIFGSTYSIAYNSSFGLLVAFIGLISLFYPMSIFFDNIISKIWLSKEENLELLKKEMFLKSSVDQYVLKLLTITYGKENIIDILVEKNNITYREVFKIIDEKRKENLLKNNRLKVKESIECLLK